MNAHRRSTEPGQPRTVRALRFVRNLARWGIPRRSLLFGRLSLGDDLLCTTVLREARRRGIPFAMMTARPELLTGNSDPTTVLPIDDDYVAGLRRLGAKVIQPYYAGSNPLRPDCDQLPKRHILAEMCALAGLHGEVALRPYLYLTKIECEAGRRLPRQIAIQSSCLNAAVPYPAKEWGPDRFRALVKLLGQDRPFIQLGHRDDPPLPVQLDLRGRTSLREAAAILSQAEVFIGLEGFLAHLARAVDCPSVVVMGGRAKPDVFGYAANRNLVHFPDCGGCGRRDGCPRALECLAAISPEHAGAAVREVLAEPRHRPLPVECVNLP